LRNDILRELDQVVDERNEELRSLDRLKLWPLNLVLAILALIQLKVVNGNMT